MAPVRVRKPSSEPLEGRSDAVTQDGPADELLCKGFLEIQLKGPQQAADYGFFQNAQGGRCCLRLVGVGASSAAALEVVCFLFMAADRSYF